MNDWNEVITSVCVILLGTRGSVRGSVRGSAAVHISLPMPVPYSIDTLLFGPVAL